jgi:SWI/SNF-related matrix-associated actin-dependent regulator 1 of chromatin subfamily A
MRVSYTGRDFICHCSFEERHIPKDAGFRWSGEHQTWYTPSHGIAQRLVGFADESAKKEITRVCLSISDWTGVIPYPVHLHPKPFQIKQAAPFALSRNRSYLALDPGLGKTICAALIHNALNSMFTIYICPPFLMANVEEELKKWCLPGKKIRRYGSKDTNPGQMLDVIIIPDSLLSREKLIEDIQVARARYPEILLIVDEAHRFKNESAERTKALFSHYVPNATRVVFLSGTPMPNRPMELYPILSNCAPELIGFMSRFEYGRRYCAGFRGQWGWDFSGASNVPELAGKVVGTFMLRLRKKDVLPELPEKSEELVFIDDELPPTLSDMNTKLLARYSPEDLMKGKIGDEHVSTYRRLLGSAKVQAAAKYIQFLLEQGDEALLVFAIHKDVIAELAHALRGFDPLVITGMVEKDERFRIAKEFQSNRKRRLLLLNIAAGGVGFNLTKATRVVFAEFSWCGADNDQAIDRAHRIGQDQKVLAQYLVHRNSIDRTVMEVVLRKKEITQHV